MCRHSMAELEDKEQLSDSQLCEELARLGSQSGPITDTTRLVYQRHLRRLYSGEHPAAKGIFIKEFVYLRISCL